MKKILRWMLSIIAILGLAILSTSCVDNKNKDPKKTSNETTKVEEKKNPKEEKLNKYNFLSEANKVKITDEVVIFENGTPQKEEIKIKRNPKSVVITYASLITLWYEAGGSCKGVLGGKSSIELYKEFIGRDITQDNGVVVVADQPSGKSFSPEKILEVKPDLVIASQAMGGYKAIEAPTKNANIPAICAKYDNFADYLKWFKVFSALTGKLELWDSVALKTLEEVNKIIDKTKEKEGRKTAVLFAPPRSLMLCTNKTLLGSMVEQLNGSNLVDDMPNPNGIERMPINFEEFTKIKPEIILVQPHNVETIKTYLDNLYNEDPLWKKIVDDMGGKDKIIILPKTRFHNKPNSKFSESYKILAEYLHPDIDFNN